MSKCPNNGLCDLEASVLSLINRMYIAERDIGNGLAVTRELTDTIREISRHLSDEVCRLASIVNDLNQAVLVVVDKDTDLLKQ